MMSCLKAEYTLSLRVEGAAAGPVGEREDRLRGSSGWRLPLVVLIAKDSSKKSSVQDNLICNDVNCLAGVSPEGYCQSRADLYTNGIFMICWTAFDCHGMTRKIAGKTSI